MVDFGKYRQRITFQTPSLTEDEGAGNKAQWIDYFTCWAKVEPLKGQRQLIAGQMINAKPYQINCRVHKWKPVSEEMRIRYGQRIFTVHSIIDLDELTWELELIAKEVK